MPRYKNTSITVKTFYGTAFNPGEEKDVLGYINDPKMVRVPARVAKAPVKSSLDKKPQTKSTEIKNSKESNKEEN